LAVLKGTYARLHLHRGSDVTLNTAAVVLTAYGNVPPERAAQVMAMLLGVPVSPGWVDKASARLAAQLGKAGFGDAMLAALAGEKALAADETPVNVLDNSAAQPAGRDEQDDHDPEDGTQKTAPGAPHVLIVRTPDGRLTWLQALPSRRKAAVAAGIPAAFTGLLMTDGYTGYQHLLSRLAGIQQCCQHYPDTAVMPMADADPCCEGEFLVTVSA
jgi:Transposase IS66 family